MSFNAAGNSAGVWVRLVGKEGHGGRCSFRCCPSSAKPHVSRIIKPWQIDSVGQFLPRQQQVRKILFVAGDVCCTLTLLLLRWLQQNREHTLMFSFTDYLSLLQYT